MRERRLVEHLEHTRPQVPLVGRQLAGLLPHRREIAHGPVVGDEPLLADRIVRGTDALRDPVEQDLGTAVRLGLAGLRALDRGREAAADLADPRGEIGLRLPHRLDDAFTHREHLADRFDAQFDCRLGAALVHHGHGLLDLRGEAAEARVELLRERADRSLQRLHDETEVVRVADRGRGGRDHHGLDLRRRGRRGCDGTDLDAADLGRLGGRRSGDEAHHDRSKQSRAIHRVPSSVDWRPLLASTWLRSEGSSICRHASSAASTSPSM